MGIRLSVKCGSVAWFVSTANYPERGGSYESERDVGGRREGSSSRTMRQRRMSVSETVPTALATGGADLRERLLHRSCLSNGNSKKKIGSGDGTGPRVAGSAWFRGARWSQTRSTALAKLPQIRIGLAGSVTPGRREMRNAQEACGRGR